MTAKSLINPMIFIFSILVALLIIDWMVEDKVFSVFWSQSTLEVSTFSSVIATLVPSGIVAPVMIFAALFQAPARLPENYVRATFAVGSIFCCLVMFALLIKNLFNFNDLRLLEDCELNDPERLLEACRRLSEVPSVFANDLRALAAGIVICLIIYGVYQAACTVLHIEQENNKMLELRRDLL